MRTLSAMSLPFLLACTGLLPAVEVAVVNPTTVGGTLTVTQVKELLRGKRLAWDDGSKVIVVLARDRSTAAVSRFLGLDGQQFSVMWKKLVFTGKATQPEQVDDDPAVVDYVARTAGAIGLVDKAAVKDGVKVIGLE